MSDPRWFWNVLLISAGLSLALSVACWREPERYPVDLWHQDTRDNQTWTEREIDSIYWTEQYQHAELLAKQEAAKRDYLTAQRRNEAASTDLTDAEQNAAWRLLWKK